MIKGTLNKPLLKAVKALPGSANGITLIDVGAFGGIEPRWAQIAPMLNYVGFEPDERASAPLAGSDQGCRESVLHPVAAWDREGPLPIHLCAKTGVSSHYPPNHEILGRYPEADRFEVIGQEDLPARTIDSFKIANPHFLKIDVQGGELPVLNGAGQTLHHLLGAELEVEFLPLYKGQPLFGDVCARLAEAGLEFIDFTNLCRWERTQHKGYGDCVFGDSLFLRSPEAMAGRAEDGVQDISAWLAICLLYNRFDLIDRLLELLPEDRRPDFVAFEKAQKPIAARFGRARYFLRLIHEISRRLGYEYRYHMIY